MQTSADITPIYCSTREAAGWLGYKLGLFYQHLERGWIAGAERHGDGPRPRYRFRVRDLAFCGPTRRVLPDAERRALDRRANAEAAAESWPNPFRYSARAAR